jgi:PDZ domain-containing secreted protein
VILKFDGKTIASSSDLPRIVGSTKPGSKVTMQVWRKGTQPGTCRWWSEKSPTRRSRRAAARGAKPAERAANRLGLVVSELTAEQKRELKVNGGLLIEDVRNNGSTGRLRPGDVILALITRGESIELRTTEQFNRQLAQFDKSANVTLLVRRGELQTFVTIKGLPEKADGVSQATKLTLVSRHYCHLCQEMEQALAAPCWLSSASTLKCSTSTPIRRSKPSTMNSSRCCCTTARNSATTSSTSAKSVII